MNTPDTEEIVKRVAENVWRSGNSYRSDAERKAEIEEIIRSLLSSRDTYWKEREQALIRDFAGLDPAERHDKAVRVLHAITNEDNLK